MQDRYVGDVGDFGKYGLLRALLNPFAADALSLGVIWYRYPAESHNDDGKHIGYLRNPRFRACDPVLYDSLRDLILGANGAVRHEHRSLSAIESADLLGKSTSFYSEFLAFERLTSSGERARARDSWFDQAVKATLGKDIVFLDPDNGLECRSVSRTSLKGPKYVYWDEVAQLARREQTLIVYHHINRTTTSEIQVMRMRELFGSRLPQCYQTSAVVYTRGTRRAYFIATCPSHRDLILKRLDRFLTTDWQNHFIRSM